MMEALEIFGHWNPLEPVFNLIADKAKFPVDQACIIEFHSLYI